MGVDDGESSILGRRDADEETGIRLLVDELVGVAGAADTVAAHLRRAVFLIEDGYRIEPSSLAHARSPHASGRVSSSTVGSTDL